jgi:hypothetical protein
MAAASADACHIVRGGEGRRFGDDSLETCVDIGTAEPIGAREPPGCLPSTPCGRSPPTTLRRDASRKGDLLQ